jgi:hypothetical protein
MIFGGILPIGMVFYKLKLAIKALIVVDTAISFIHFYNLFLAGYFLFNRRALFHLKLFQLKINIHD